MFATFYFKNTLTLTKPISNLNYFTYMYNLKIIQCVCDLQNLHFFNKIMYNFQMLLKPIRNKLIVIINNQQGLIK